MDEGRWHPEDTGRSLDPLGKPITVGRRFTRINNVLKALLLVSRECWRRFWLLL